MSAGPRAGADTVAHAQGTRRSYLIGFGLSVALTAIPFWLVMGGAPGGTQATAALCVGCAFAQIIVHMVFFLHVDTKSEGGWTMMALLFTLVLVVIAMSGTLWVMFHLASNMMPMSPREMRQMP